jgi:hypothetical protein
MSVARVVAGILAAAALIFGLLWWRAPPGDPVAPDPASGGSDRNAVANVASDRGPETTPPATTAGSSGDIAVPLASMVRSEVAAVFRGLRLPDGVAEALADGRIDAALQRLDGATDGDAAVALAKLSGFCAGAIGSAQLDAADLRRHGLGGAAPETAAMLERTLQQQRDWGRRVVQGCEQAGLLRNGPPDAQARAAERNARLADRLQRCADAGNAACLVQLARREGLPQQRRMVMLQSAAILGSVEAQELLLAALEFDRAGRAARPEDRQAARYWRESLAKSDPEYRAALVGCYDEDCDPRRLDRAAVRAQLESAMRDGSLTALTSLMTSERDASAQAGADGRSVDVGQISVVNPSETDAYAWKSVGERLALGGCLGLWPTWAPFVGGTAAAERELRPSQLDEARRLAERHWQSYGRAFAAKRGCDAS